MNHNALTNVNALECRDSQAPAALMETGVKFYDDVLGGTISPEVYGLLAPADSFKTGGLIQLAVAQANVLADRGDDGMIVFVSYAESKNDISRRIVAHTTKVPVQTVRANDLAGKCLSTLSRQRPEELQPFALEGEQSRLDEAATIAGRVVVVDFSDASRSPFGAEYVHGLGDFLELVAKYLQAPIRAMFIDNAKAMAVRYARAQGLPQQDLWRLVADIPGLLRRHVTARLGCCAWVAHTLKTPTDGYGCAGVRHHSEACWATDFAENLDNCFCMSTIDRATNCLIWNPSKTRWTKGSPPKVLHIDPDIGALEEQGEFVFCPKTKRIVCADAACAINGNGTTKQDH